jgi:hypothetical protein
MTKEVGRSLERCGGEDLAELEMDTRRRDWDRPSATTLDNDTDGVAGVTDGRPEVLRFGVMGSRSTFLRFGEECNECVPSVRFSAEEP